MFDKCPNCGYTDVQTAKPISNNMHQYVSPDGKRHVTMAADGETEMVGTGDKQVKYTRLDVYKKQQANKPSDQQAQSVSPVKPVIASTPTVPVPVPVTPTPAK